MRHGTRQLCGKRARHGACRPAAGLVLRRSVAGLYSAVDRQAPEGGPFSDLQASRRRSATVTFRTEAEQLEALMPPGFKLHGDPLVTIETHRLTDLHWLAGRGYNILTVKIPAEFKGKRDRAKGRLLVVMWEDLPDAILPGREELGYSKLYCELPEPRVFRGREHHSAM